jgi:hypothetical protein
MPQIVELSEMTWEPDKRSFFFIRREAGDEILSKEQLEFRAMALASYVPQGQA